MHNYNKMLSRENAACLESIEQKKSNQNHSFLLPGERFIPIGNVKFEEFFLDMLSKTLLFSLVGELAACSLLNDPALLVFVFPGLNKSAFILRCFNST